jgi:hypothetical protein
MIENGGNNVEFIPYLSLLMKVNSECSGESAVNIDCCALLLAVRHVKRLSSWPVNMMVVSFSAVHIPTYSLRICW